MFDPAWARELGLAVRERAIAEFDKRIVIAKTLGVYGELAPPPDNHRPT